MERTNERLRNRLAVRHYDALRRTVLRYTPFMLVRYDTARYGTVHIHVHTSTVQVQCVGMSVMYGELEGGLNEVA